MIATVEQQKYAVEQFERWLSHPSELGRPPEDIEIERVFDFEGEAYLILKYKKEKDGEWLFGVCGGFIPSRIESSNIVWSEFEPYDEAVAEEKCKGYIKMLRQKRDEDPIVITQKLIDEKKWQEVIDFVDANIEKYRNPRTINGAQVVQYYSNFDVLYYTWHDKKGVEWINGYELKLLNRKLFALVELNDARALETVDEMLEIAPHYATVLFERIEYYKRLQNYDAIKKYLDEMYPTLWNASDFARYLRVWAWLGIEEGDIEAAIHYLSWTVLYDDSKESFDYVNNELGYIKQQYNFKDIPRPNYSTTFNYFKKRGAKVLPDRDNVYFCMQLYDDCLRNRRNNQNDVDFARQNLVNLTKAGGTSKIDPKVVEVNVLTPNWYMVNYAYGCACQAPKDLKAQEVDKNGLFNFVSQDGSLKVWASVFAPFEDEDMFNNMIEGDILYFENIYKDKMVQKDVLLSYGKVKNLLIEEDGNKMLSIFLIKINPNHLGRVYGSYTKGDKDAENKLFTVVNTWEFLD